MIFTLAACGETATGATELIAAMVDFPETLILDKPFIYIIADDSQLEGLPIFMGTVENI